MIALFQMSKQSVSRWVAFITLRGKMASGNRCSPSPCRGCCRSPTIWNVLCVTSNYSRSISKVKGAADLPTHGGYMCSLKSLPLFCLPCCEAYLFWLHAVLRSFISPTPHRRRSSEATGLSAAVSFPQTVSLPVHASLSFSSLFQGSLFEDSPT